MVFIIYGIAPVYGIQMNQKELTKTVMMISNWKNPLASEVLIKYSALWGLIANTISSFKWRKVRNRRLPIWLRGFVKLKKFQKSEKNSKVSGWVKPQLGFFFFLEMLCFFVSFVLFLLFYIFQKKKKWVWGWVCVVWPIRVSLGLLDFFNLTWLNCECTTFFINFRKFDFVWKLLDSVNTYLSARYVYTINHFLKKCDIMSLFKNQGLVCGKNCQPSAPLHKLVVPPVKW